MCRKTKRRVWPGLGRCPASCPAPPLLVDLGVPPGVPSEAKQMSETWAGQHLATSRRCLAVSLGCTACAGGADPFGTSCIVMMHWPGEAEHKSGSNHGPPSSLQCQGCSHNPTFCVPFKINKRATVWSSEELPRHCGFHIVARAQGIVRKALLGGG